MTPLTPGMTAPPPPASPATTSPPWWRAALCVLLAFGLLVAMPHVRGLPPAAGVIGGTLLFLLVSLLVVSELASFPLRPAVDAVGLVLGLGAWYAAGLGAEHLAAARTVLSAGASISFLLACVCAGRLLALIVRERNLLLPVALVAGMADIFTVVAGPTGEALKHAPKLVEKLSVAIPKVGSAAGPAGAKGLAHIATAGLGDFIFLAFFLAGVARFGLRGRASFWGIYVAVALGMGAVLFVPGTPALPLLPFMVAGFLVANLGVFRLSRPEKLQTALVVVLLAGLLVAAALTLQHRQALTGG